MDRALAPVSSAGVMPMRRAVVTAIGLLAFAATGVAAAAEELVTVPTRPGVTQSFLVLRPAGPPAASVVLFAGGHGALALSAAGVGSLRGNFLVRNRARFAEHGLLVAVIDAPSDRGRAGLVSFRASREHAEDVRAVMAALRRMAAVPVWAVGTSMGTVSAANAAARLKEGGPDGLVLTSSITRTSRSTMETLNDVPVGTIAIPALVVHHKNDGCAFTPYRDAVGLIKELKRAPKAELLTFDGGDPPLSEPCEAMSAHGYVGLDAEVVAAIAGWIKAAAPR